MTPPTPDHPTLELRRLLPEPGHIQVGELLESLTMTSRAHVDRPFTIANFVASVDGRASADGRSGGLSDPADRQMFHGLRELVDAVLVGTGTLRAERYGPLVRDPARRARRAATGLNPEPLACIITRSGNVPTDIPLFTEPGGRVVVFTPRPLSTSGLRAEVEVVHLDEGELTLTTVVRRLRSSYDVRALLCEGGPTLFGSLLHENLVDELFLSLEPKLVGGGAAPTISSGPALIDLRNLSLLWANEHLGSLFLRYGLH